MNRKIYAEVLEESALEQFNSAMSQDYVVSGALMPDAHTGYSLPIGAVVATKGFILPAWVGYDIGCGMCALMLDGIDKDAIKANSQEIFDSIYNAIPVGFKSNSSAIDYSLEGLTVKGKEIAEKKNYKHALGSLGGGNHFIEIGHDEKDNVWVVIHSGSRGVGHGIASHYVRLAHPENKCKDGHYGFSTESQEGKDYIQDLAWGLNYALANRKEMMERVVGCVAQALDLSCYELDFSELINRNHNHATEKDGLWIHRKGATHADKGMMGVIPGNMRDGSFIVRGLGNPDSLYSSSHGAGRVLGRKQAKRELDTEVFKGQMLGIMAKVGDSTLDESPSAYKNIFDVMDLQKDLVEVVCHIKPLINIKG
jgi:tRNA-splicing ligase RtcB